jgi:hypothetical protein
MPKSEPVNFLSRMIDSMPERIPTDHRRSRPKAWLKWPIHCGAPSSPGARILRPRPNGRMLYGASSLCRLRFGAAPEWSARKWARRKAGPLGRPRLGTPTQPGRRPAHHSAGVDMHDYARRMTAPDTQAPSTGGDRRYARSRDRLNRGALSTVARRKQELRHVDGRGERDRNPAGSLDPFQVDRRSRLRVHSRAWATLPTCLSMP